MKLWGIILNNPTRHGAAVGVAALPKAAQVEMDAIMVLPLEEYTY